MALVRAMADVHFNCPACLQKLVADENGAGLAIDCPHCGKSLKIPFAPVIDDASAQRAQKSLAKWVNRATALESDLSQARKKLDETERQLSNQRMAFAENTQRLRATTAENQCLKVQADEERGRREALEMELRAVREEAAILQKQSARLESARQQLHLRVEQSNTELIHARKQLDGLHIERAEVITDVSQTKDALVNALTQLDAARKEQQELQAVFKRAETKLERAQNQVKDLETDNAKLSEELAIVKADLRKNKRTLATTAQQRDKLSADLRQNHELTNFLTLKDERDRLEKELREMQAALSELREKLDATHKERETLKKEKVALNLKLAAARDSHSSSQLQEDNEVLRRLVERLNEELKERPAPAKRRRQTETSGRMGEMMRGLWQRCFVSDPDVT
jgi:predicted nuclease with TOPRIM domain